MIIRTRKSKKNVPKRIQVNITDQIDYQNEFGVERELVDKFSFWMLKIIDYIGISKYIKDQYDNINKFLGFESDIKDEQDYLIEFKKHFQHKYNKYKKQKCFSGISILEKNIKNLSKLMRLNNNEERILEFIIYLKNYWVLEECVNKLGHNLNNGTVYRILSAILDIPIKDVKKCFSYDSKFMRSSLLILREYNSNLIGKFDLFNDNFMVNMLNLDIDIMDMMREVIKPCGNSDLSWNDFEHMTDDIELLLQHLKYAYKKNQRGTNILFYGPPGTGKTEFVKVIAEIIGVSLFEISYETDESDMMNDFSRFKAYKMAQMFLANKNTLLMFDEIEVLFDKGDSIFNSRGQTGKSWINRTLENNLIPTIWISNDIGSIDSAIIRRYDMCIKFPVPSIKKRIDIIKKYSDNILKDEEIEYIAKNDSIAPALISKAADIVKSIEAEKRGEAFIRLVNNTLKAQGHKVVSKANIQLPKIYNPEFINCEMDLSELEKNLREHQNVKICLYGPSGTGKSAFAKYIAQSLEKELYLKKGSDLLNPYVGMTEKYISDAFENASIENAVLVFDEIDSFIQDRNKAGQSWEVTMVNEMLVQMENFNGLFIATTNLMDILDVASLRRFDLKLKFDFMTSNQAWKMLLAYCEELGISKPDNSFKDAIKEIGRITPGNFATIARQNRFWPIKSIDDLIERLFEEVSIREPKVKIGFSF